jgi:hypothetical protein
MDFGPVTAERQLTSGDSPIPDQTAHGHQASATTAHEGIALRASKALTHGAKPNSGHALRRASNRAMTVGTTGLSGRREPFAGEVARSGAIAGCADARRPRHSGHRHQSGSKTSSPENHRSMPSDGSRTYSPNRGRFRVRRNLCLIAGAGAAGAVTGLLSAPTKKSR